MINEEQYLKEVGKRIRAVRDKQGLTQEQFAEELGVSRSTYQKYELGNTSPPIAILHDLYERFNVSADFLLNGTGEKTDAAWSLIENSSYTEQMAFALRVLLTLLEKNVSNMKPSENQIMEQILEYMKIQNKKE